MTETGHAIALDAEDRSVRVFESATGANLNRPTFGEGVVIIIVGLAEQREDAETGTEPRFLLEPPALWDDTDIVHVREALGLAPAEGFAEPLPDDLYLLREADGGPAIGLFMSAASHARFFDIDYADGLAASATVFTGWVDLDRDGDIDGADRAASGEAVAEILSGGADRVYLDVPHRDFHVDDIVVGALAADLDGDGRAETIDFLSGDAHGEGLGGDRAVLARIERDMDEDGKVGPADAHAFADLLFESGLLDAEAEILLV